MMNAVSCRRTSPIISKNFKKHLANWKIYAVAGGAVAATGTRATADVLVYQGINQTLVAPASGSRNAYAHLKTVGGAVRNLRLVMGINHTDSVAHTSNLTTVPPFGGAALAGSAGLKFYHANASSDLAKTFAAGAALPGSQPGQSGSLARVSYNHNFTMSAGTKDLGFYTAGGGAGWIRVNVAHLNGVASTLQVIDLAYHASGGGMMAGQLPSAAQPVPGSMALAILAAGSDGLVAMRNAKAQVAAQPVA